SSFGFAPRTSLRTDANFAKSDCGLPVKVGFVTVCDGSPIFARSASTASSAAVSSCAEPGVSTLRSMRVVNAGAARAKLAPRAAERVDRFAVHRARMGGGALLGQAEGVVDLDRRPLATAPVGHGIAGDRVQPGEERLALPAVPVDVRERPGEDLTAEVLGVA